MARIFISYKRIDKEPVYKIRDRIESSLHESCWIDLDGIRSDAVFVSSIIKAIDECEVFLYMYSKSHTKEVNYSTDWTIRELNYAQERKKRIVFVNIDGTELLSWYLFMFPQKQQVDAQSEEDISKLITDLAQWLNVKQEKETVKLLLEQITDPIKQNDLGNQFYKKRHFADALQCYIKSASQGYDVAQYNLGYCYMHGRGCVKDVIECVKWFSKAAEQGHSNAQYMLAYCYEQLDNGMHDLEAAYKWYLLAAKQEHAKAQERIGYYYFNGIVVKKDYTEALKWYKRSADQGIDISQFMMGRFFEMGYCGEINIDEAIKWYGKAALQGHITSQHLLIQLKSKKQI